MKFKHLKGPWAVRLEDDEETLIVDANYIWIASINMIAESKSNARLIAAAPEMLEALIEAYKANDWLGKINYQQWNKEFECQVKDIIERATGMKIEEVIE